MTPPKLFEGRRRALFAGLIGLSLLQAVALCVAAVATRAAFAALHAGAPLPFVPAVSLAIAGMVAGLTQYGLRVLAEDLGQDYAGDIRLCLFDHASRSLQADLNRRRLGYQVLRVTGDLTALKGWPGLGLPRLIQAAILLPAAILVLWYLHPAFGWLGIGVVVPSVFALALWYRPLWRAHRDMRRIRARLAADMTERLPIARQLAAFGRRGTERQYLSKTTGRLSYLAQRHRRLSERLKVVPEVSAALVAAALIALGSHHALPAASIAAALAALALTVRPLRNIMSCGNQAAAFAAAHTKLRSALARPLEKRSQRHVHLNSRRPTVEIFQPSGQVVTVASGEEAHLPSEAMEAVSALLTGMAGEERYTVRLDGQDVRQLTAKTLRSLVGTVTDRPLILKGSMRRNLTMGLRPRPDDSEIHARLKALGLAPVLEQLGGLDRSLSERGSDLTPAERMLLSSLRAHLQDPGLVLLRCSAPLPLPGASAVLREVAA